MKPKDDPDVLPAREIIQSVFKVLAGQQFDAAVSAAGSARLPRRLYLGRERRSHEPDRGERQAIRGVSAGLHGSIVRAAESTGRAAAPDERPRVRSQR